MNAKTILSAAALAAAFVTGAAQAAPASNQTGEAYGYGYRVNDARSPFSDGARAGKFDPYTDGARTVAGRDRTGVSAEPGRTADTAVETA